MKIAKIVPVYKSGSRTCMDNYRPIALLSNFSKILEKIVAARLTSFFDTNNILSGSQFGFRQGHSTLHPTMKFMNYVSNAFNKKEHVLTIFCDLRKAFDTVDHEILLKKMASLGIRGVELAWFKNYLTDRKQYVYIKGKNSSLKDTKIGVPQGSILGPLLFLIYINDLPLASKLITFLFADDTTLLAAGPDIDALFDFVNNEFHKIVYYFRLNKLSLHPKKTQFMILTCNNHARLSNNTIFLNNNNLSGDQNDDLLTNLEQITTESSCPAIKFLGIYFDPLLNFKYHISTIAKKISSSLYFMRAARNILTKKALKSVYYALVHSHLMYGIQIWGSSSLTSLQTLQTKQKNAVRIIHNATYNSHTESLFKSAAILPLNMMIEFFKLQFMQQYVQGYLPPSFNNTWLTNEARRNADLDNNLTLRNSADIYIPPARITMTQKHPLTSFPRAWVEFNFDNIKLIRNKNEFNRTLKRHFLDSLNENYTCNRLLCPHCHL